MIRVKTQPKAKNRSGRPRRLKARTIIPMTSAELTTAENTIRATHGVFLGGIIILRRRPWLVRRHSALATLPGRPCLACVIPEQDTETGNSVRYWPSHLLRISNRIPELRIGKVAGVTGIEPAGRGRLRCAQPAPAEEPARSFKEGNDSPPYGLRSRSGLTSHPVAANRQPPTIEPGGSRNQSGGSDGDRTRRTRTASLRSACACGRTRSFIQGGE